MSAAAGNTPVLSGRNIIALSGMQPGGRRLVKGMMRPGVLLVESARQFDHDSASSRKPVSIVIVACPGDDLSAARHLYSAAVDMSVLVTAILIRDDNDMLAAISADASLQSVSDIIVNTPDPGCIEDILDTMIG